MIAFNVNICDIHDSRLQKHDTMGWIGWASRLNYGKPPKCDELLNSSCTVLCRLKAESFGEAGQGREWTIHSLDCRTFKVRADERAKLFSVVT